jgi:hypothetical protein
MKAYLVTILSLMCFSLSANAHEGHQHNKEMENVLQKYLTIQESLANDSLTGIQEAAQAIQKSSMQLTGEEKKNSKELMTASGTLTKAKTISEAREAFKKLSEPVVAYTERTKPEGIEVIFCSMAKAKWVQKKGDVKNPFYGKEMQTCGEKAS